MPYAAQSTATDSTHIGRVDRKYQGGQMPGKLKADGVFEGGGVKGIGPVGAYEGESGTLPNF